MDQNSTKDFGAYTKRERRRQRRTTQKDLPKACRLRRRLLLLLDSLHLAQRFARLANSLSWSGFHREMCRSVSRSNHQITNAAAVLTETRVYSNYELSFVRIPAGQSVLCTAAPFPVESAQAGGGGLSSSESKASTFGARKMGFNIR